MILNVNSKTFIIQMAIQKQEKTLVHSKKQAQGGTLLFDKAFIKVLIEYSNYNNIFLVKNAAEFLEKTEMNEHAI